MASIIIVAPEGLDVAEQIGAGGERLPVLPERHRARDPGGDDHDEAAIGLVEAPAAGGLHVEEPEETAVDEERRADQAGRRQGARDVVGIGRDIWHEGELVCTHHAAGNAHPRIERGDRFHVAAVRGQVNPLGVTQVDGDVGVAESPHHDVHHRRDRLSGGASGGKESTDRLER